MSEDNFTPPPVPGRNTFYKILWVVAAFFPSLVGIALVSMTNTDNGALSFLIILNIVCCIAASMGLVQGIEPRWLQVLVAVLLIPAVFVANVFIVVFVGCTMAMTTHGGL
jgi:hypothetical protein